MVAYAADATVIPYLERKDPGDTLDYVIDWAQHLDDGESLTAAEFSLAPTGLTVESATFTSPLAVIWLSGGTVGTTYLVTCQVTTSAGRMIERSFRLLVEQR